MLSLNKIIVKLKFLVKWLLKYCIIYTLFIGIGTILINFNIYFGIFNLQIASLMDFGVCNLGEYQLATYYLQHENYTKAERYYVSIANKFLTCNKDKILNNLGNIYYYYGITHIQQGNVDTVLELWKQSLKFYESSFKLHETNKTKDNIEIMERNIDKLERMISKTKNNTSTGDKSSNASENIDPNNIKQIEDIQTEAYQKKRDKYSKESGKTRNVGNGAAPPPRGW